MTTYKFRHQTVVKKVNGNFYSLLKANIRGDFNSSARTKSPQYLETLWH